MTELAKTYDPHSVEPEVTARWLEHKAFAATPDDREHRYVIMMPLPNVTGALHMGHAMDNVMQDLLVRWHRMSGDNTLWMAGTDHAGIATQAVVEKRLLELEGVTRQQIGRNALVERIWQWKAQYQQRIVGQQQAMGCSCDWDRQRFTMDAVCARAVRHTFFKLFRDGLIYQGYRLVNWDCQLQTAVSDDELYKQEVHGHFWHLRYPVIDPRPGEPTHIVVATTRPETMLGDTAVACHPEPASALEAAIDRARDKLAAASAAEEASAAAEVDRLEARRQSHLPLLRSIAEMAADGRQVMLPLMERAIPIICDEWAKPELGSGCVKITPAHDPNDYDVWQRHEERIDAINILAPDGTLNDNAGKYRGLDRFVARQQVVAALEAEDKVEAIEDRSIEVDHSDRSKTIVEPYLSQQWFVRMGDVEGGVRMAAGTDHAFTTSGLAQAAIDACDPNWHSPTGRRVEFHPDERYRRTYTAWLAEKRDWCISRQLWWGHRIPVWRGRIDRDRLLSAEGVITPWLSRDDVCGWITTGDGRVLPPADAFAAIQADPALDHADVQLCFLDAAADERMASLLESVGLARDPDVLDTWFSSALWPHSTLGWPDPASAAIDEGQTQMAAAEGRPDTLSYYYPGSCLVTGRDIITLWVARMVIMGLYNLGDVPFTDVFIHASIQDGKGERMSKSKGNGIDPVDIIEKYGADAMRYVLCEMQTGTQDVRLPVQVDSPFTGKTIDLATAKHGRTIFTYVCPDTGKEFDVLGTMDDVPAARPFSERFEVGRNFCNKLWNSARFAYLNLDGAAFTPRAPADLELEDRWILSRLANTRDVVQQQLEAYTPAAALNAAREFFWGDFCDWYLELIKPRLKDESRRAQAQQVLAATLDTVLRLLHPLIPFITEELWLTLGTLAPERGIEHSWPTQHQLVNARWPDAEPSWHDPDAEATVAMVQEIATVVRDIRASHQVPPSRRIAVVLVSPPSRRPTLEIAAPLLAHATGAERVEVAGSAPDAADAATGVVDGIDVFVPGVVDREREKKKLSKQRDQLQGRIAGTERKLQNQGFVAKAPPEVVERERRNLAAMAQQLQSVEASLAALQ